jgi:hypothetical protein
VGPQFSTATIINFGSMRHHLINFYCLYFFPQTNGRSGSNAVDTSLYIGPDGKPLTDDEQAFLEENLGRLDSTSGCDTHSLTEDREFIDDYEKFLASQN